MAKLIREGGIRKALLVPLCVFYYYHYGNYIRMGKSKEYAVTWAPMSASGLFMGPFSLLIMPISIIYNFFSNRQNIKITEQAELIFVAAVLLLSWISSNFLEKNQEDIISNLSEIPLPSLSNIILLVILFSVPMLLISVAISPRHFYLATALVIMFYSSFYFLYFRRLIAKYLKQPN